MKESLVFTDLVYTGGKTGEEAGTLFRSAGVLGTQYLISGKENDANNN